MTPRLAGPTSTTSPFGASTWYTYNDTASPPTHTATINGRWTKTTLDGFGRTIQTDSGDTQTRSTVQVQYAACGCSPLGKMSKKSQPYAPNGTIYWTTYAYDGLGRTTKVTAPDGSVTQYAYQGNMVTATDPAGKWKKFTMDAFGNLTQVDETDPTLGAVSTYYTYDILNHLTQVRMPRGANTQYRTFDYTGGTSTVGALLLSATNPETNNLPVSYTYNTNKQLTTRTDANGNQFGYTYDSSGRLTLITANGNTLRTFYYDTNPFDNSSTFNTYTTGRLTAIQNATYNVITPTTTTPYYFTEMFAYQQAPAVTTKRLQLTESVTYATGGYPPYNQATVWGNLDATYTYDNEGRVLTTAYPATQYGAGPSYSYQLDGMGRLSGMTDQNSNQVVSGVTYGPANELDTITYFRHIETRGYNTLFQLTSLNGITYAYTAGANNGKIFSQTYTGSGETVQYTYDSLNRLASAAGSGWSQTFTYDGFGNLTNRTPSGPATPADPTTNRLSSGYSYDNNGNLLTIGYAYDAENRLISALSGSVQYSYDSQNKRIWQANFDSNGYLTYEQVFLYGANGKKLGTYNPSVTYGGVRGNIPQSIVFSPATTNAYFGGKLIQQGGTTFVPDRLESNGKYFPYGEERNYPALPNDQVKFATYTRDSATGLDYADQRYYASSLGRFMTPDPYQAMSSGPSDPKTPGSWNRYSYVQADPVNGVDRAGTNRIAVDIGDFDFLSNPWCTVEAFTGISNWLCNIPMLPVALLLEQNEDDQDRCHVEIRYSEIVIKGVHTGYNHTMLVGIDDTTGATLGVIDGYPSPTAVGDSPALQLNADVTPNGHYDNANAGPPTTNPYVDTRSNAAMCDRWDALVAYAENFPNAIYAGYTSNSNSLTTFLWQRLGQSKLGPPPGTNTTPGWNGPIVFVP